MYWVWVWPPMTASTPTRLLASLINGLVGSGAGDVGPVAAHVADCDDGVHLALGAELGRLGVDRGRRGP